MSPFARLICIPRILVSGFGCGCPEGALPGEGLGGRVLHLKVRKDLYPRLVGSLIYVYSLLSRHGEFGLAWDTSWPDFVCAQVFFLFPGLSAKIVTLEAQTWIVVISSLGQTSSP
ncbi:hypothetical protein HPP92_017084 [Vanilla planifolia]|uniref:Uncharacterized protein n=1 Tax=Vanilla planifolia TaxID=51239 RepID=A0A835QIS4_VANPL|nr:hypothetical protein HPP92_017084 [Vanilla planifolia]